MTSLVRAPYQPQQCFPRAAIVVALLGVLSFSYLFSVRSEVTGKLQAADQKVSPPSGAPPAPAMGEHPHTIESYGHLPLSFEANHGQTDTRVTFLSRGSGYTLFLTGDGAVLALKPSEGKREIRASKLKTRQSSMLIRQRRSTTENGPRSKSAVLKMKLVGANPAASAAGLDELPGKSNYFIGNDPKQWRTNVPTFAKVRYQGVYPGVDLVYYGNQRELEYDFVVAPGADPRVITLEVGAGLAPPKGVRNAGTVPDKSAQVPEPTKRARQAAPLQIAADGDLVVNTDGGEVRFHKPVVYQTNEAGRRSYIDGRYVLAARKSKITNPNSQISFNIATYDHSRPLVIDPVLSYSTYFGGNGLDQGNGIAVDAAGYIYVTGAAGSTNFPTTPGAFQTTGGFAPAFVAKFNPAASGAASLIYSTYLGASTGSATGVGVAVDTGGNAYVTGSTAATNFPTTPGAFQTTAGSPGDAFVTKLGPTGSTLVYSTYLGGSGNSDQALGIALDSAGNACVTGFTDSPNFPTTPSAFQTSFAGGFNAFVTKINTAGSALVYSTYLGGSGGEQARGIAVDVAGNIYVTGSTSSSNFPTTPGAYQTALTGAGAAFVSKFNPAASGTASLVYSTYLGGASGTGIAVDVGGNAYMTGFARATGFSTTPGAFQTIPPGGISDDFVTKLNATGSALVYSTYLGGNDQDEAFGIAVDAAGNAYVTGDTFSTNFPLVNPLPGTTPFTFGRTTFVTKLNATGSGLMFSTLINPNHTYRDVGNAIALDSSGNIYVAGITNSSSFPTVNAFQATCGSCNSPSFPTNAFLLKISGLAPSVVLVFPASLALGSQQVGVTSAPQVVTLTNNGTSALTVTSIAASGDFTQTNTCGTSVAATSNCAINVTFTPTAAGARTGALTISDSDPSSPQSVSLTGTGTVPGTSVSVSPPSLTFANQPVGIASSTQTVTLTNTGTTTLNITSVAVTAEYAQTNNCGSSVAGGANCTIYVTLTPTAAGSRSGTLTITDNASGSPQTVALTGTGIDFIVTTASGSSSTQTVTAGQTATYTLVLAGTAGFSGTVSLACTGTPAYANCVVAPGSTALSGTTPVSATVKVTTTARAMVAPQGHVRPPAVGGPLVQRLHMLGWLLAVLAIAGGVIRKRVGAIHESPLRNVRGFPVLLRSGLATMTLFVVLLATVSLPACGGGGGYGGGGGVNPGTPAGSYNLTVTATLTGTTLSHNFTLTMAVQ